MELHTPRGLPAGQARFLCLLAARPSLNRADYQRLIAVSYTTAKRYLGQLAAAGLSVSVGRTRDRRYALSPVAVLPLAPVPDCAGDAPDQRRMTGSDPSRVRISIDPISIPAHRS